MGPPRAAEVLREALYRGADQVILLTDRKTAGRTRWPRRMPSSAPSSALADFGP